MPEGCCLYGRRLLVVEDDYMVAMDVVAALEGYGATIIGPAATVNDALELIATEQIDAASLDINLGGERVYPVADALAACGVPFVFASGYDPKVIPEAYADIPRCDKPVNSQLLMKALVGCLMDAPGTSH